MSDEWGARAEREAVAIIDGVYASSIPRTRSELISVLAIAWLQGVNVGCHDTLAQVEASFEIARATL